jgi:hypothetical protein
VEDWHTLKVAGEGQRVLVILSLYGVRLTDAGGGLWGWNVRLTETPETRLSRWCDVAHFMKARKWCLV